MPDEPDFWFAAHKEAPDFPAKITAAQLQARVEAAKDSDISIKQGVLKIGDWTIVPVRDQITRGA